MDFSRLDVHFPEFESTFYSSSQAYCHYINDSSEHFIHAEGLHYCIKAESTRFYSLGAMNPFLKIIV